MTRLDEVIETISRATGTREDQWLLAEEENFSVNIKGVYLHSGLRFKFTYFSSKSLRDHYFDSEEWDLEGRMSMYEWVVLGLLGYKSRSCAIDLVEIRSAYEDLLDKAEEKIRRSLDDLILLRTLCYEKGH